MLFKQTYALLSAVLATSLATALPSPQAGGITGCSAEFTGFITIAGEIKCPSTLVCNPALIPLGQNPCDWPTTNNVAVNASGTTTVPGTTTVAGTTTIAAGTTTTVAGAHNGTTTVPGTTTVAGTTIAAGTTTTVAGAPNSTAVTLGKPKPPRKAPAGERLVLYWSAYDNAMTKPSAAELVGVTQLIFAFVDMKTMTGYVNNFPDVADMKKDPIFKGIKFTAAFGGWDLDEEFRPKTIDDSARAAFADEIAKFVTAHNLDGVDMDWEYPGGNGAKYLTTRKADPEEGKRFALFLEVLREKLGEDKIISLAVPAKEADVAMGYDSTTVPYMDAFVDEWNIMSYDFLNRRDGHGVTGHHAGTKVMTDALALWKGLGVDPGPRRIWEYHSTANTSVEGACSEAEPLGCSLAVMENPDGSDAGVGLSGAIRLDYSLNMRVYAPAEASYNAVKAGTAKIFKDTAAGASAWYDSATNWFWSFMTADDVAAACKEFKPKVGGIMIWALHQDGEGAPLLSALNKCYSS